MIWLRQSCTLAGHKLLQTLPPVLPVPEAMGKRDLDLGANMDINVNAPRSKRRHTEAPVKAESVEPSAGKDEPSSDAEDEATNSMTLAEIREFALKVLEVIKNAVDKE